MIYIVGAGPGDPDLITVKGRRLLEQADVILYAGSLVNPVHLEYKKEGCLVYNTAYMHLEQVTSVMERYHKEGKMIVRLHTGDPSIYGAIREQMDFLRQKNIPFEVVPGVSSFCGAAAVLQEEFTLPDVSQTVILSRVEGRTGVPEKESLASLAAHKASLILFLSVSMIEQVSETLIPYYGKDTPVAVVYKATWPEEIQIRGTLETISQQVKEAGIRKTALILVGWFMGREYSLSKLYDKTFQTEYRR